MQEFTIFDIVIIGLAILVGLKGFFRGFIKEAFGLVGIIGGIFIASRINLAIGIAVAPILGLENSATIKLTGFILALICFWLAIYIAGATLSKMFSVSGLGIFDRVLGLLFGSAKVFLIFSVIVYSIYQINSFKSLMDKKAANSRIFPFLVSTGGFIIKLNPVGLAEKIENKTNEYSAVSKEVATKIKKTTISAVKEAVNENIEKLSNKFEKTEIDENIKNQEKKQPHNNKKYTKD